MTTEQCSVDSLLPKSRTETFARQLQNRLRNLNSEIDGDGHEDTSWNGDQLSSSSDDIYYDLDSYPGSPAEEAAETSFTEYINIKTSESVYPAAPVNTFSCTTNHNACTLPWEKTSTLDYGHVGQYSRADSINHCKSFNGSQNGFSNKPERESTCCGHDTSEDFQDAVSSSHDRLNNFSHRNELHQTTLHDNHSYSNGDTNESITNLNGFNCNNLLQKKNNDISENSNHCNGIKDRLSCNNEIINEIQNHTLNENETKILHENETQDKSLNSSCCCLDNENKPIDMNSNLTASNNNINSLPKNSNSMDNNNVMSLDLNVISPLRTSIRNDERDSTSVLEDPHLDNELKAKDKEKYTEEDLCRLVDAVFIKSQENGVQTSLCENDQSTNEENKVKETDNEEEETIESRRSRFRRSSSLKTGKTPPGTPANKKIVRFADVLGLDLADVRTFLDEVPRVPKSAFVDLKDVELSSSPPVNILDSFMGQIMTVKSTNTKMQRTIVPLFQQPSSQLEFIDRVRNNFVCLENAVVTDSTLFVITGIVRVKNIDFHKSVHIRYSIDNWKSFADLQAKYVQNSCDGFSDKFTFVLYAHMLNVGQRLEFAVRYHVSGSIHWDNNYGANYTFQCVPEGPSKVLPTDSYAMPKHIETWASFY